MHTAESGNLQENILVVTAATVTKQGLDNVHVLYNNRFQLIPNPTEIALLFN